MQIEMWDIERIKEYQQNPRLIGEQAVDAVAASIKQFGFKVPVIVDTDGVLIAGHTRVRDARRLGLKEVPVIRANDLTPEQVRAFRIADNKLHELATWDMELLPIELSELRGMDVDLELLGFSSAELEKMLGAMGTEGLTDPDTIPEPPDEAITQPGDLWLLGNHRLLCGDSSKAEDVDRLLDGATIQLVNTDPPYNVKVEPRSSTAIAAGQSRYPELSPSGRSSWPVCRWKMHHQAFDVACGVTDPKNARQKMRPKDRPLEGDFISDEEFARLLRLWFGNIARILEPGRAFYIWGGDSNIWNYPNALHESQLYFSQMIIWVKEHPVLVRKDFLANHELCFYGWRPAPGQGRSFQAPGSRPAGHYFNPEITNATDVWSVKKVNPQAMVHLTEKPVELAERAMIYSSRPGENVLDLFGGSGSTLIAAEKTGRRALVMEIDPLYCDVIVRRWEEFTGKKAERVSTTGSAAREAV